MATRLTMIPAGATSGSAPRGRRSTSAMASRLATLIASALLLVAAARRRPVLRLPLAAVAAVVTGLS